MREIFTCTEHGFRWASGDKPCPTCQAQAAKLNESATKPTPRTKRGRVWPVKGDYSYGR